MTNPRGAWCSALCCPAAPTGTFSPRLVPAEQVSHHVSGFGRVRVVHCLHAVLQAESGEPRACLERVCKGRYRRVRERHGSALGETDTDGAVSVIQVAQRTRRQGGGSAVVG
jgi:hypothetical protein